MSTSAYTEKAIGEDSYLYQNLYPHLPDRPVRSSRLALLENNFNIVVKAHDDMVLKAREIADHRDKADNERAEAVSLYAAATLEIAELKEKLKSLEPHHQHDWSSRCHIFDCVVGEWVEEYCVCGAKRQKEGSYKPWEEINR